MNDAAANGQPVAGAGSSPGATLLAERRRQNLSLGDVSRQLKLSVRQVEALERDDYSGFQGPVFVHGFMRNYAKLLALDPNPLIRAADCLLNPAPVPVEPDEPVTTRAREVPKAGKSIWPAVTGVVAVMLVAGLMFMNRGGHVPEGQNAPAAPAEERVAAATAAGEKRPPARPAEKPVAEKGAADKSAPEKSPAEKHVEEKAVVAKPVEKPAPVAQENLPPMADAAAVETGPRLTIRMIFEQDSWVEIKDRNGNTVFGQLNAAGTRRSARGEPPLSIVVGNAAGVRLFQGDKSIDLAPHTRVDVARLTVE